MKTWALSLVLPMWLAAAEAAERLPTNVSDIVVEQHRIRDEIQAGTGSYADMATARKDELLARQASLLEMLEGKRTTDELSESERGATSEAIAWIRSVASVAQDAAAKEESDDRMVCERRQILGSNRKERVCMTAAQMKLQRERTQERLQTSGGDLTR